MIQLSPPADDEIEITVFGRGYGESCVLHVGGGRWVIVDSYNYEVKQRDPKAGRKRLIPVARWYLDQLGVASDAVEMIVITHFHRDHYVGLLGLLSYYDRARLVVTNALNSERFLQLYGDESDEEMRELVLALKLARRRSVDGFSSELRYWGVECGRDFSGRRLSALSPTQAAADAVREELARLIATTNREALTDALNKKLLDENCCSVVLHFDTLSGIALLCGDLPNNPPQYGWEALVMERAHAQLRKADYVKVAHHGSAGANHPLMWDRLVEDRAAMTVAPHRPSGIPVASEIQRLAELGDLWQAAPTKRAVSDAFGNVFPRKAKTGIIQARRTTSDNTWRVEFVEAAFKIKSMV